MHNILPYKSFYIGDVKISALGSLDSAFGDDIRNFKAGNIDYPKLVIDSFLSYYREVGKLYDRLLFIPSNRNKSVMEFFAKEISYAINVSISKNIMFTKEIKEQKLLETLVERKNNVFENFVINSPEELINRKLLIIDDVYASGETMKEVLKEFIKVGIDEKNIDVIVFALREYVFK